MNHVSLTGNLCKDNDVRMTSNGKTVIRNSIACKRNYKNQNGTYDSDFINLVVYEPHSKFMQQYIGKGDKVAISGRWQHRTYQAQDGSNRYVDECVVDGIELLAHPQNQNPQAQAQPQPMQDDNPWDTSLPTIDNEDLPF